MSAEDRSSSLDWRRGVRPARGSDRPDALPRGNEGRPGGAVLLLSSPLPPSWLVSLASSSSRWSAPQGDRANFFGEAPFPLLLVVPSPSVRHMVRVKSYIPNLRTWN